VIEGTQGVGKTNLLNYYERELEELYRGEEGAYIIRYYPDPEPSFDGVLRRIFQELGDTHLALLGDALAGQTKERREEILEQVMRNQEMRCCLRALSDSSKAKKAVAQAALEWLLGLRLLNRHRELLGVSFRLDTVESKTQALKDIVEASIELGCLKGIFLLLDELEKQDLTLSKTVVLRYLLAIRALVDALPRNFFLMIGVTPEAKRRYFEMVPAFQGRLQNSVGLKPIGSEKQALELAHFYVTEAREAAAATKSTKPGQTPILSDISIRKRYTELRELSAERGLEGVTHRDLLNALHDSAEEVLQGITNKS
jgi:hypothetical protein